MIIAFFLCFLFFVALLITVWHLLISCHNFSLFVQVPCILFYSDLLTSKTHPYKPNSMNSLNSIKELWKNSITKTDRHFTFNLKLILLQTHRLWKSSIYKYRNILVVNRRYDCEVIHATHSCSNKKPRGFMQSWFLFLNVGIFFYEGSTSMAST